MTDMGRMSVGELAGKVLADEHADVLRQAASWLPEQLTQAEVTAAASTGYGQRHPTVRRAATATGNRPGTPGSVEPAIPGLRFGSHFPSFLQPRRRSEQALVAMVRSDGDDDLAASMALYQMPDGLRDLTQRVGPVDHGRELAGLDQLPQGLKVLLPRLGAQHPQPLAHHP
jgi:Transposase, Mutator family